MKRAMHVLAALFVTAACLLLVGLLARAPYDAVGAENGLVRLSWRFRDTAEKQCRTRTQAELDALPVHMRTPEVCDDDSTPYRLIVQIDAAPADSVHIAPGGVRGDRPVYVLWERRVAPGAHRIQIEFLRLGSARSGRTHLAVDTVLHARAGAVDLITLSADARRLVHRTAVVTTNKD